MKTYRKLFLILMFLLIGMTVTAQVRLDVAIDVPIYFGISMDNESAGMLSQFTFLFPELGMYYVMGDGALQIGLGARLFTLILESIVWPNAFIEMNLGDMVVSAQLGGGAFGFLGFFTTGATAAILIGDLSVAYKLSDSFRIGVGALMIGETDETIVFSEAGIIPYTVYAFGKFTFEL